MVEFNRPQHFPQQEGHRPNTDNAVLELHRLLAVFLASKNFSTLRIQCSGEVFDPIFHIQEVEEDEISRLLLNLAIIARVIDDRRKPVLDRVGSNCGQLVKDVSNQVVQVLSLREACNKIIHAKKIFFDREEEASQLYLKPTIHLYGEQKEKHWKATLDIVAFSKDYFSLVCYL